MKVEERIRGAVGRPIARADAREKVTGAAQFATDVRLPKMAYAKVWRSPVAHARIRRIDTAAAGRAPGVICVLTRDDFADIDPYFGPAYKDQPILAIDRVRFDGEPVVGIVARTEREAAAAVDLVEVELDPLPCVTGLTEALAPGAPLVHEQLRPSGHFRDLAGLRPVPGTNICHHWEYERGEVGSYLRGDLMFDDTFVYPMVHHLSMEPHVMIAEVTGGRIVLWGATQHPFPVRKELAEMFGVPLSQVRVIVPYIGGAYGNKSYTKIEPLVVAMARKAKVPVRFALTAEEAFKTVRCPGARCRIRTRVDRDGTMLARHVEIWYQIGAYADVGPRVAQKAGYTAGGPYRIPNLRIDSYAVYTNTTPSVAFRGYGVPQATWAYEAQLDRIASELGIDRVEIRRRNLLRRGEAVMPGDRPADGDYIEGLEKAAAAVGWTMPLGAGQGRGIACTIKAPLAPSASTAIVRLHVDGSVTVLCGTVEIGQGARTAMAQIAAEELGLPPERVAVARVDTQTTPYDQATSSSRSTTMVGSAVRLACQDLRRQVIGVASRLLDAGERALVLRDGRVWAGDASCSLAEIVTQSFGTPGGELIGRGTVRGERGGLLGGIAPFWEASAAAVRVRVDRETGQVRVLDYVSVADVGRAINPQQCEGQDEGAAMMGMGHTLFEEMLYEDGQLLNAGLLDYRVPTFGDLPESFRSVLIQNEDGSGPFGAKGIGEGGLIPTSPAVAAAVWEATGAHAHELPLTPERIWRLLRSARS
jgi:CO/xanthine dehydrogenase Mo-binding subunit